MNNYEYIGKLDTKSEKDIQVMEDALKAKYEKRNQINLQNKRNEPSK